MIKQGTEGVGVLFCTKAMFYIYITTLVYVIIFSLTI